MDKKYITWEEFHKDTKVLCEKIKMSGNYDKIVAVSRGGLIPAGIISYELDIRNVEAINVSTYDGESQRDINNIEIYATIKDVNDKTLIVDDLSDTGNTYKFLRKIYPSAKFVTIYSKSKGTSEVDIYAKDMPDNWIVFPWD